MDNSPYIEPEGFEGSKGAFYIDPAFPCHVRVEDGIAGKILSVSPHSNIKNEHPMDIANACLFAHSKELLKTLQDCRYHLVIHLDYLDEYEIKLLHRVTKTINAALGKKEEESEIKS